MPQSQARCPFRELCPVPSWVVFRKQFQAKGFCEIKLSLEVQACVVTLYGCPPGRPPGGVFLKSVWVEGSRGNFAWNKASWSAGSWLPGWLSFHLARTPFCHLKKKGTWTWFLQFCAFWFFWTDAQLGNLTPFGYLIPQEKIKVSGPQLPWLFICAKAFLLSSRTCCLNLKGGWPQIPVHLSSLGVFLLSTSLGPGDGGWGDGEETEERRGRGESPRCTPPTSELPLRQMLLPGPLDPQEIGTLGIEAPWGHRVHTGLQLWSWEGPAIPRPPKEASVCVPVNVKWTGR